MSEIPEHLNPSSSESEPKPKDPPEHSRSRSRSNDRRKGNRFPARRRDARVRPSLAGGLLTFKQFMELQHFPMTPFDAQKYYEEYKTEYERKHLEIFFSEHKDEHWFTEKYDPIVSQRWQEERFLNAKVSHRIFIETVRAHGFTDLKLSNEVPENEKISGPPYFGFDPNSMTLFLKTIPVNISRWDLLNVVKTTPGFVSLSMSEPLKSQGFCRFAWVLYDSEEHCNESLALLTNKVVSADFRLSPVRSQSSTRREIRTEQPQPFEGLLIDWRQSARLIVCLDKEKGIAENPLLISEEQFVQLEHVQKELQLDLQLLYLRRVHAFCYYCVDEYEDERMLAAKCGPAHIRSGWVEGAERGIGIDEQVEARLATKQSSSKYDQDKDSELQRMLLDFENREIREEQDRKVRCKLCSKLFRGMEFIRKHFQNKHQEEINQVVKQRLDALKLENYLNDPDKLSNPITYAGESFRFADRRKFNIRRRQQGPDTPYEDLDDPSRTGKRRQLIDYDDIQ